MALSEITKITGSGIKTDTNWVGNNANFTGVTTTASSFNVGVTTIHSTLIESHNIVSTGVITATGGSFSGNVTAVDGTFSGNVSIAGTLTYEDVTNVDSVGIVTAAAVDVDDFLDVGSNIKLGNAGVITATSFVGSGAALTGIDATAIKDSGGNVKIQAQASGAIHSGVSTFQDLDVDGHTNLDNISVSGVSTFSDDLNVDSGTLFVDVSSNRTGINTTTPRGALDIKGTTFAGGAIHFDNTAWTGEVAGKIQLQSNFLHIMGGTNGVLFRNTVDGNVWSIDKHLSPATDSLVDIGSNTVRVRNIYADTYIGNGNLGIVTSTSIDLNGDLDVDGHTNLDNVSIAGVVTATSFSGDGSALTGITQTTINNNADNRVITGSGTANTLNGESSVLIDSSGNLLIDAAGVGNASVYARNIFISGSSNNGITIHTTDTSGVNRKCCLFFGTGTSVADMADGMLFYDHAGKYMHFSVNGAGTGVTKSSIRLSSDGTVRFDSTPTTTNSISLLIKSHKARAVNDNNGILFRDANDHSQAAIYVQKKSTSDATSDLIFATSSGQVITTLQGISEQLRIDSSGRIGSRHNLSGTADYNRLMLHNPHSGSCWMQMTSTATGSTPNTDGLSIGLNTSNIAHFWLRENAEMQFATNNSLRWRITSSGDVYPQGNYNIGLNSNTAFRMNEVNSNKFVHRYGNSGSATTNQQEAIWYGGGITVMHDNQTLQTTNYTWGLTGSRGYPLLRVRNANAGGGAIYSESGGITSGSDYRMKENIEEITNGIETVKKLKPSKYNIRKSFNPEDDGTKHHGFIAHEVQEAIPDIGNIVTGTKDAMEEVFYQDEDENIPEGKKAGDSTGTFTDNPDMQGIDYGHMTPVLAAAIKELITKVETLETKVATLEGS